jgi:hypothetical protein
MGKKKKGMDLDVFRADADKEVNGVWTEIEFRGQTGQFKIARAGNPKFTRIYTKYKNSRTFSNPESQEAQDHDLDCLNRAFAEAILIDTGEEITDKGEPVKYTPELGYMLMTDPNLTELKNQIATKAGDFEMYAVAKLEEITKN